MEYKSSIKLYLQAIFWAIDKGAIHGDSPVSGDPDSSIETVLDDAHLRAGRNPYLQAIDPDDLNDLRARTQGLLNAFPSARATGTPRGEVRMWGRYPFEKLLLAQAGAAAADLLDDQ